MARTITRQSIIFKVLNPVEALISTQNYLFLSKYVNSISWPSPYMNCMVTPSHRLLILAYLKSTLRRGCWVSWGPPSGCCWCPHVSRVHRTSHTPGPGVHRTSPVQVLIYIFIWVLQSGGENKIKFLLCTNQLGHRRNQRWGHQDRLSRRTGAQGRSCGTPSGHFRQ